MSKKPKHVFVFFQQTGKQNSLEHNPYIFNTFDLDGDNTAKLSSCRLQYGTNYLPDLEYDSDFKLQILNDLVNYRYRKKWVQLGYAATSRQLLVNLPYSLLWHQINQINLTGDPKSLTLHYWLNEAANAHDYTIYTVVLNEEEVVVKQVGNELVIVWEKICI